MASLYNINRSVEAYDIRMIDPADGQLKSLVDIPTIGGGGGGGDTGYTDNEIDTLLNTKVDLTNASQVITGNVEVAGDFTTSINNKITCNNFNSNGDNSITFQRNGDNVMVFDVSNDKIELNKAMNSNSEIASSSALKTENLQNYNANGLNIDTTTNSIYIKHGGLTKLEVQSNNIVISENVDLNGNLKTNIFDSYDIGSNIEFRHNGNDYMRYNRLTNEMEFDVDYNANANLKIPLNGKLLFTHTNSFIRETLDSGNFINYVLLPSGGITTQEHRFYVNGETSNELVMTIDQNGVNFLKGTTGGSGGTIPPSINVDTIDTTGDNDMTVKRNNVIYYTLEVDGSNKLMNFASNGAVSANKLFGNYFSNRSYSLDTIFEGSNIAGNDRVEYMRYDFTNEVIQLPKKLLVNGGDGKTEIYESTEATNNVFRIWNKETTNTPVIHLGVGATSNDMVLSSSGLTFNKAVACSAGFSVADNLTITYNKKIQWGTNSIVETSSPTVPITRFDAPNTGSAYWFFVGPAVNDAYRILTISNTEVLSKRVFKCNNIDSENNTDLVFKRNGNEYMRLDQSEDEVVVSKKLRLAGGEGKMVIWENTESTNNVVRLWNNEQTMTAILDLGVGDNGNQFRLQPGIVMLNDAELRVNTVNSNGVSDVSFQRNSVEYFKLDGGSNLVNIASGIALSTTDVYTNEYRPRSSNTDTVWYGLLSSGTGSAEIFRYDYSAEALDFNTIIDNTGRSVIGNLIDTTVSDERLKSNIKEIKTNCISCESRKLSQKHSFTTMKNIKRMISLVLSPKNYLQHCQKNLKILLKKTKKRIMMKHI